MQLNTNLASDTSKRSKKSLIQPSDINSIDDLFPVVRSCIKEILDVKNYPEKIEVCSEGTYYKKSMPLGMFPAGEKSVCDIAADTLINNGFDEDTARGVTHPFQWFIVQEKKLVGLEMGLKKPYVLYHWVIGKDESRIDKKTTEFLEEYGPLIMERIKRIREYPEHRRY